MIQFLVILVLFLAFPWVALFLLALAVWAVRIAVPVAIIGVLFLIATAL